MWLPPPLRHGGFVNSDFGSLHARYLHGPMVDGTSCERFVGDSCYFIPGAEDTSLPDSFGHFLLHAMEAFCVGMHSLPALCPIEVFDSAPHIWAVPSVLDRQLSLKLADCCLWLVDRLAVPGQKQPWQPPEPEDTVAFDVGEVLGECPFPAGGLYMDQPGPWCAASGCQHLQTRNNHPSVGGTGAIGGTGVTCDRCAAVPVRSLQSQSSSQRSL